MRIAIVDDVESERKELHQKVSAGLECHAISAEIFEYNSGEPFLTAAKQNKFALVFMDIYMGSENGIDISKKLRSFDKNCLIVLTTTSTEHALEGFRVRAFQYLVKPYTENELSEIIDEIVSRLPVPDKYLNVRVVGGTNRIRLCDILYAEHYKHCIHIHTVSGKTTVTRKTFSDFTAELNGDERFFVCNRGIIINLEHAKDYDGTAFTLDNKEKIAVSRNTAKNARAVFGDFLFKRGQL